MYINSNRLSDDMVWGILSDTIGSGLEWLVLNLI